MIPRADNASGIGILDCPRRGERYQEADSPNRLTSIEGHCAEKYFEQMFGLFNESVRPEKRKGFKSFNGIDNIYNLSYVILKWKVHQALWSAKLEPYLGYLHEIAVGKPSLVLDFLELYRYVMDDFILSYARNLKPRDFTLKDEDCSPNRKGKRQYLRDKLQNQYLKSLNGYFKTRIQVPRMRRGSSQELETLINDEVLLFAQYLRGEKLAWHPRVGDLPQAFYCPPPQKSRTLN